ncbi:ABC transporter permease [Agaribacterium sp. ZY112]|uniref:ABC transporter permease n=1 Tax=Agaribacterium sp. ZY112 TaxID=3233574 RepID=UPI003523B7AD
MNKSPFPHLFGLATKLLKRDLRSGNLSVLALSLLLGVATVTSISLFSSRIHNSIYDEAAQFMAADASVGGTQAIEATWSEQAREQGLKIAETVSFSAMVFSAEHMALGQVKAVSSSYPLLGSIEVGDKLFSSGDDVRYGPAVGELWIAPRLFDYLQLNIGDTVALGDAEFKLAKIINREPDQGQSFFGFAPRVMIHIDDVDKTNAIQLGSRISYKLMLTGESEQLTNYKQWLEPLLGQHHYWSSAKDANQSVVGALERAENFLLLAGSLGVILGGAAIALAARRYALQHVRTVALLKTMGCKPNEVMQIFFFALFLIALISVLLGSLLGWFGHYLILLAVQGLFVAEPAAASFSAYFTGVMTGFISLLAFAVPPLLQLKQVTPAVALKRSYSQSFSSWKSNAVGVVAVLLLLFLYSSSLSLTFILFSAALATLIGVYALSWLSIKLVHHLVPLVGAGWRLGLNNLQRHRQSNAMQIVIFSTLLMLVALIFSVRTELVSQWQNQLPEDAANHFAFNIQSYEADAVKSHLKQADIDHSPFYPMTRGRITTVNGVPLKALVEQYATGRIDYEREVNLSSALVLGEDNVIVQGQWWGGELELGQLSSNEEPLLLASVEESYAKGLNLSIGDIIIFSVAGQELKAKLSNIRTVKWDSMNPNFYILFNQPLADSYGANWLTSFYLASEDKDKLNKLARSFPTLSLIELDQTINQLQSIIEKISAAVEFILVLIFASGFLVLVASIQATLDMRFKESAILRTLGADKALVRRTLLIEFGALGLSAGILAAVGSELALYFLQLRIFNMDYVPFYWLWPFLPVLGAVLIALAGWLSTRKVIKVTPMSVLRS